MSEILPRVLLPQEGNSALCLKASGSNSFAGFNRAIRADDLWAPREQLTPGRARFHSALCGPNPHENSFHLILHFSLTGAATGGDTSLGMVAGGGRDTAAAGH